jgi:hypothetical protein
MVRIFFKLQRIFYNMFDMDFGGRDCLLIFSHFQCVMFWALHYQPICIGILQATICYASCCMRKFRSLQRLPSPGDCVPSCVGIRVLALWTHFVWYLQNNSWLSFCTDGNCNTLPTAPVYHVQLFDEKYCRNVSCWSSTTENCCHFILHFCSVRKRSL